MYEYGYGDLYNMIFYSLIWIIIHAVIHEYIWEVKVINGGSDSDMFHTISYM